jgi:tetratricopeptide (TPR) repeat protein
MNAAVRHLWVVGPSRAARGTAIAAIHPDRTASCHAQLRGPYTGILAVLDALVPQAYRRWPELVDRYAVELHYTLPELSALLGPAPTTLVAITPHEERTRYYGRDWIRAMSQGVITFLLSHAARVRDADPSESPITIALDDLQAAEPTAQEFVAILVRRADPSLLRVVAGSTDAPLPPKLASALATWAERVTAPDAAAAAPREQDPDRLVRAFVESDGTSDDPAELAAYQAADPLLCARLHDERADALSSGADRGLLLGAVPYHRELGSDPTRAGRAALRAALELCVAAGYSDAIIDFGMRGRALCDPDADQQDYCHFTAKAASAMIAFGRVDDCAELYRELRRRYPLPRVQMTSSNALAILHTRFYVPRDHELALELGNNARALAALEPDPVQAAYFQVYQDNGLALIEMHRGNLERAYDLVDAGLRRLDRELPTDRYLVHRSQLMHNRARVLVGLGRWDEAYVDFSRLIEWDPYYVEYHTDRGNLSRRRGDLAAAIADYDRAVTIAAPFPEMFYNRSVLLQQVGRYDEALDDLDYLLEMEPDFLEGRVGRGSLHLEQGRPEAALTDARAGLTDHPGEPRLWCLAGLAEQELDAPERARDAYTAALTADPSYAPALVNRAVLAYERGDPARALDDLSAAVLLLGEDPDVLGNRGVAYTDLGRYDEALADFDRALAAPGADRTELLIQRSRCLAAAADRGAPDLAPPRQDLLNTT